jgi:adenylate cyclase
MPAGVTLRQALALFLVVLALLLGALLVGVDRSSAEAVRLSAEPLRQETAALASEKIEGYFKTAEDSIDRIEIHLLRGRCSLEDPSCAEGALFAALLANPNLVEATFTRGGAPDAPPGRPHPVPWQVGVSRGLGGTLVTRVVKPSARGFEAQVAERPPSAALSTPVRFAPGGGAPDPTAHPTFLTPASAPLRGQLLWSDLSFAELDAREPPERRRVVVTVLKALERGGDFAGVARVAILGTNLDALVRAVPPAPRPLLCDERGRLLARLAPGDPLDETGEDLRVAPRTVPPEVRRALEDPAVRLASRGGPPVTTAFTIDGRRYLASFEVLRNTQDWRLGILVDEDALPGIPLLRAARKRLLAMAIGTALLALAAGFLALGLVGRDLARIVDETSRMGRFDFSRSEPRASFRDVTAVMAGLERAKTALRAMGKYVPLDLVRLLYASGVEPVPGGELHDVSLLFTDIEGFTTLSEATPPDELARLLGAYFEVMGRAIQGSLGTIDKFIGDAVMALWNAPLPVPDHPQRACEAALAAIEATGALYRSAEWAGRAPLVTRFGLHRGTVLLGHFGAPDRLSYTALGDGVNLAARLEGLNKQYGTRVLVSESIREAAGDLFVFRLLDRVAVKGKTDGIEVSELVGRAGTQMGAALADYERALRAHWSRDFAAALAILEGHPEDPPSRVLAARCRAFLKAPPPADWDGVHAATSK